MVLSIAYERATEEISPGMDLAEYVLNGPDYGGFVSRRHRWTHPVVVPLVLLRYPNGHDGRNNPHPQLPTLS